jgi:hypothetical protein
MPDYLTVSDVARELSKAHRTVVPPRDITNLFYRRELRDDVCPVIGGRRLIPRYYLPVIETALRRNGRIKAESDQLEPVRKCSNDIPS